MRRTATRQLRLLRTGMIIAVTFSLTITGCEFGPFTSQSADPLTPVSVTPNDPRYGSDAESQWYLDAINAPGAWGLYEANVRTSYTGEDIRPVIVSVIDTGIVAGHEDLAAALTSDGVDFVGGVAIPIPTGIVGANRNSGHGTHVAGLIGAIGGNGVGISGATYNGWPGPMVRLRSLGALAYSATTGTMSGHVTDVVYAILYASAADSERTEGAQSRSAVINMSLGASSLIGADKLLFENAIAVAVAADIVLVAASGNAGSSEVDYPARFDEVIAVGSVDRDASDQLGITSTARSSFSNYGLHQELVAPGATDSAADPITGILSTFAPSGYFNEAGTSMSTPLVAAAAALVRSANPYLSAEDVRQILQDTAHDLGDRGWDSEFGYGLVDMEAALRRALSEPYGRFSSSLTATEASGVAIVPKALTAERKLEYDRARAEALWDPDGTNRVSVLLAAGSDPEAILAIPGVSRIDQTPMPEGILLRVTLDGANPAWIFEYLRNRPDVLLLVQDKLIDFST